MGLSKNKKISFRKGVNNIENAKVKEAKIMGIIEKIGNLTILNCLFIVSSLPLITIVPALMTINQIGLLIYDGVESKILPCFYRTFKKNFKLGMSYSIIILLTASLIGFNLIVLSQLKYSAVIKVVFLSIVLLFLVLYLIVVTLFLTTPIKQSEKINDYIVQAILRGFHQIGIVSRLIIWNVINLILFIFLFLYASFFLSYYLSIGVALLSVVNGKLVNKIK